MYEILYDANDVREDMPSFQQLEHALHAALINEAWKLLLATAVINYE